MGIKIPECSIRQSVGQRVMIHLWKMCSQITIETEDHIIVWVKNGLPRPTNRVVWLAVRLCEASIAAIDPAGRDGKQWRRGLKRKRCGIEL